MVQINFARQDIRCKVVYCGPDQGGKTSNLKVIHARAPKERCGELTSIPTEGAQVHYLPIELGVVSGLQTNLQLFTVPSDLTDEKSRRAALLGADAVIFVADSQASRLEENLAALHGLERDLRGLGLELGRMPQVFQYTKRDLPDALPLEELERALNPSGRPSCVANAATGDGVFAALKKLSVLLIEELGHRYGIEEEKERAPREVTPARPATAAAEPSPISGVRFHKPRQESEKVVGGATPGGGTAVAQMEPPPPMRLPKRTGRIQRGEIPEPVPMKTGAHKAASRAKKKAEAAKPEKEPIPRQKLVLMVVLAVAAVIAVYTQLIA